MQVGEEQMDVRKGEQTMELSPAKRMRIREQQRSIQSRLQKYPCTVYGDEYDRKISRYSNLYVMHTVEHGKKIFFCSRMILVRGICPSFGKEAEAVRSELGRYLSRRPCSQHPAVNYVGCDESVGDGTRHSNEDGLECDRGDGTIDDVSTSSDEDGYGGGGTDEYVEDDFLLEDEAVLIGSSITSNSSSGGVTENVETWSDILKGLGARLTGDGGSSLKRPAGGANVVNNDGSANVVVIGDTPFKDLRSLRQGSEVGGTPFKDLRALRQGSEEWYEARRNRLTGSNFAAAIGISPYAVPRSLWEMFTNKLGTREHTSSAGTLHGNKYEAVALSMYEQISGVQVKATGFWVHPKYNWLGASPDGLVGDDGVVEVKCPLHGVHEFLPRVYMPQLQAELACTQRKWVDFVSWYYGGKDGREHMEVRVTRVWRSDRYWSWMFPRLEYFWNCVLQNVSPAGSTTLQYTEGEEPLVRTKIMTSRSVLFRDQYGGSYDVDDIVVVLEAMIRTGGCYDDTSRPRARTVLKGVLVCLDSNALDDSILRPAGVVGLCSEIVQSGIGDAKLRERCRRVVDFCDSHN